jgi:hypothetical protein
MGSSSKVPPPDPRLVDAQLKSMGYQDQAIQQVLGIMQQQQRDNRTLLPMQREAMRFALDANKTAFQQSQSDRGWLLDRRGALTGMQDQMIGEASTFNSPAEQERRAAAAQANVGQAMAQSQDAAARQMASMGVAPNSGRMGDMMRKSGIEAARLGVGAANAGRLEARNEGRMLTDRAANALAGYPAAAMGATGQGAGIGTNQISAANMGAGGINAGYGAMTGSAQAAGGLAGSMGGNATGMYGQQAQYKLAADQASGMDLGGIGSVLGGAAKLYGSGIFSERSGKQDIERIGTHTELGIGIYRFRYKPQYRARWGDGEQVGVMIDELQAVLPEAVGFRDGFKVVNYSML